MDTILIENREYDLHDQFNKYLGEKWNDFEREVSKNYECDFATFYCKELPPQHYCYISFGDTLVRFYGGTCVEAVQQFGKLKEISF